MLNQRQDDERARLKAAGFTDAEIDAGLGAAKPTRPPVRVASESTAMQGPGKAPARAATDLKTAIGTARALAQGATFGFGDELEAGARSLAGAPYKTTRDQIRGEQAAYVEAHPVAAIGAELAGGLLTGGAALKAAQGAGTAARVARVLAPKVAEGAGVAARLGAAARSGAAAGALMGAGNAAEARNIAPEGAKGAAIGAAGGVAVGTLAEAIRGARNLLGGAVAGAERIGRRGVVGRAIEAESPEQAGVRRTLNAARRGGQTLDDLEARSAAAPNEATLGSLIDRGQGTRAERIMRNVGRERDVIDASLAERSAETPAMWYRTLQRETGVPAPRDVQAVAKEAHREALTASSPLYAQANALPDVTAPEVGDVVETLRGMREFGPRAVRRAETLAAARDDAFPTRFTTEATPDSPSAILGPDGAPARLTPGTPAAPKPVAVRHVLDLRRGLDEVITEMEQSGESPAILRELAGMRSRLDAVAKGAGEVVGEADAAYAGPMQRAESFAQGARVEQAGTEEGVNRLAAETRDPEAFRQGAASKLLERASGVADGEAGQTRNPVAGPLGSPTRRARTRAAFPDDASFERARADAEQIVRYLQEQRAVSGNSATAGNLSEIADEFGVDVSTILQNATSPTKLALALFKDRARGAVSGMNASQATAAGRLLFSGLPGQQPRTKALATMRELAPAIEALMVRQATLRGQVGARATDRMRR